MALILYETDGIIHRTDERKLMERFMVQYQLDITPGKQFWDQHRDKFLESAGIGSFLNGALSWPDTDGLAYQYRPFPWVWECIEWNRKHSTAVRYHSLLNRLEKEQLLTEPEHAFLSRNWPEDGKASPFMDLIILGDKNGVTVTDQAGILVKYMENRPEDPLPENGEIREHYRAWALNGLLSYSKEKGGFGFEYAEKKKGFYGRLQSQLAEDLDPDKVRPLLREGLKAGEINGTEYQVLNCTLVRGYVPECFIG